MNFIREKIFKMAGIADDFNITYKENGEGLSVELDGKNAVIGYATKAQASRAHFLLTKAVKEGRTTYSVTQKPSFDMTGVMINASSGVPTVEGVKNYIDHIAALGMNMLMLYTEDTYEMKEYPYFGHMKSKFTVEELREIDEYGYQMGVELIPCIQTLAHLAGYLLWQETKEFRQSAGTLLVDAEATYQFIENEIKTMRAAFRSGRIHVGMDEAADLGTGQFFVKHGFEDRFDIFNRHLNRVCDICKKYEFNPMIWSDLYFTLGGNIRYDYDEETVIPQHAIDNVGETDLVFWDYYHDYQSFYDINIDKHRLFGRKVIYAGAVWDWDGFSPNMHYSLRTMLPALTSCIEKGVKEVFSTTWGGIMTLYYETLPMLPIFSEMCYLGKDCTEEDIYDMSYALTGVSKKMHDAQAGLYLGYDGWGAAPKRFVFCDVFLNLIRHNIDFKKAVSEYEKCYQALQEIHAEKSYDEVEITYYELLAKMCLEKAKIRLNLKKKYEEKDREYLRQLAEVTLPELLETYRQFRKLVCVRMKKHCRIQGLDSVTFDLSGAMGRMEYAIEVLQDYVEGRIDHIDELEIEVLTEAGRNANFKSPGCYAKVTF